MYTSGYSEIYPGQHNQKELSELDVDSFFSNFHFQGNQCQLPIADGRDKTYLEILWAAAFLITACLWFVGGFGTS